MTVSWSLLLAFLVATLVLARSAEPGSPRGKRRLAQTPAGGGNTLQYPPHGPRGHGRHESQGTKGGSRPLLHRALHPLARPEDDGTGLEGMSPVRLEPGPGRDRTRVNTKSGNHLVGAGKGRGHRHHYDHRRHGSRHKGRRAKGKTLDSGRRGLNQNPSLWPRGWLGSNETFSFSCRRVLVRFVGQAVELDGSTADVVLYTLTAPVWFPAGFPPLGSALKDRDVFQEPPFSVSSAAPPSHSVTPPSEPTSPMFGSGSSMVATAMNEHPPTLPPASTKPQVTPVCLLQAVSVV